MFHRARALSLIASMTLLWVACLTPPPAPNTASSAPAATVAQTAPAAPTKPREFTHSSKELLAGMKLGWNLANSLDAPESEPAGGTPPVTPELLQTVAGAGFSLVRIPVTWSLHTGPEPEFTIEPAWL